MTENEPLELYSCVVRPEWIDYNGHMNVAYYLLAFDYATDAFFDHIGLDQAYKTEANSTTFALDINISYLEEVLEGDPLGFTTQLLDADEKRLHFFHSMYHADKGYLSATNEILSVHISLENRRVAPMRSDLWRSVAALLDRQNTLPTPKQVGRPIGIRRK